MTISYKLTTENICILKIEDGLPTWSIPIDEENTDYQEYLIWAKTNTTEEADKWDLHELHLTV